MSKTALKAERPTAPPPSRAEITRLYLEPRTGSSLFSSSRLTASSTAGGGGGGCGAVGNAHQSVGAMRPKRSFNVTGVSLGGSGEALHAPLLATSPAEYSSLHTATTPSPRGGGGDSQDALDNTATAAAVSTGGGIGVACATSGPVCAAVLFHTQGSSSTQADIVYQEAARAAQCAAACFAGSGDVVRVLLGAEMRARLRALVDSPVVERANIEGVRAVFAPYHATLDAARANGWRA